MPSHVRAKWLSTFSSKQHYLILALLHVSLTLLALKMSENEQLVNIDQKKESPETDSSVCEQNPETDLGSRGRTMTEKGRTYQISLLEEGFKTSISSWRRQSNKLSSIMTDSNDIVTIRNHRDLLDNKFEELSKAFERLQECKEDHSTEAERFETVETDHQHVMLNVAQLIRELNLQRQEISSNRSFRSAMSMNSKHSNMSKISDVAARKAALQAKLKYIDVESKCKAQLQKIQTMKEIEIEGAKFDALGGGAFEFPDADSKAHIPLIKDESEDYVKEYVQSLVHPPCPIEVNVLVSESNVSSPGLHGNSQSLSEAVLTTTPSVSVINTKQSCCVNQSFASTSSSLDPSVPVFVPSHPQSSTQSTWVYNSMTPSTSASASIASSGENIQSVIQTDKVLVPSSNGNTPVSSSASTSIQNVPQSSVSVEQGLLDLAKSLADQITVSRLPPPEPSVFSGDPLSYPSWRSAFQILIEQKKIPVSERLHYLKRYISGPVKDVIEGYFLLSTDTAYEEAKDTLDKRYGDPFIIANAFRDKLERWPRILPKDGIGLRKLADFLRQCQIAMQTTKSLSVLDDERENRKLLAKLPDWIVSRWGRTATKWKDTKKEYPPFKNFVEFITCEAKIACDPVTSLQSLRGSSIVSGQTVQQSVNKRDKKPYEGRSFLSETNESGKVKSGIAGVKITCTLCKKPHDLDDCKVFTTKSMTERKAFIKEKGLCFACLQGNHISRRCKHRKKCKVCRKLHPSSLHGDTRRQGQSEQNASQGAEAAAINHETSAHNVSSHIEDITQIGEAFLGSTGEGSKCSMIVPVYLSHCDTPEKEVLVYALLDTQSDTTFVLHDTCSVLGLSGIDVKLSLSTMHAENRVVNSQKIKGLSVRGLNNSLRISLPDAYTRNIMPANRSHIPTPEMARQWPHLEPIAEYLEPLRSCEIGLLIGYNCPKALVPREVIAPSDDGPYGQRTDLGWSIVGVIDHSNCKRDVFGLSHRILSREVSSISTEGNNRAPQVLFSLRTSIKEIVSGDVLGILESEFNDSALSGTAMSQHDRQFLSILSQNICFKDGHYEMPLPFKNQDPHLPNNKSAALVRLKSLRRRLEKEDTFCQHYSEFMQELIRNGHAEKVPQADLIAEDGRVWYIPHHGVYHPQKPDKIRVVFDCSARFQGVCLNDCLLQGPDLTNKLVGVLCRFRKEPVSIMCDVEKMFYQFRVSSNHQDYLRFFWWDRENFSGEPVEYRMKVHLFGATSSPGCSNFGFKRMAEDSIEEFGQEVVNFICRDFYVDDGLKSVPTVEEAINLVDKSRAMCDRAGLRLHKFVSNVKEVIQHIEPEDRAKDLKDVNLISDKLPVERALGIYWCIESDTFQFRIVIRDHPLTRRGILSSVCSMYDPLGFIAPVVLTGKQILQQLCAENVDWDDPLPRSLCAKWENWCKSLHHLKSLHVDRCVKPKDFGKVKVTEVHHFSDASSSGYGQCSYLRLVNQSGQAHCSLLLGKSRVVPLRPITIPRLQLTAALLSVKTASLLDQELDFTNLVHIYWTDSKVVLGYLANESRRFHVFVAIRVQQIKDHTSVSQWRYIDTKGNPADIASRGITAKELVDNPMWFKGPKFLWNSEIPESSNVEVSVSPTDPEVKKGSCFITKTQPDPFSPFIERFQYFSDWNRTKKAVAVCLRFLDGLRSCSIKRPAKVQSLEYIRNHFLPNYIPLTVAEIQRAEFAIVRMVQAENFSKEIKMLQSHDVIELPSNKKEQLNHHKLLRGKSQLQKLNPFLGKDGLMRVGGRIQNSLFSDMVKFPLVLPRKGHVTQLVINHFHARVKHQGRGITTQAIRSNGYWVIGCSAAVSSQISKCVECRRLRSSTQDQKMADLPTDRLEPSPPFTYCAVDFFGPWHIKEGRKELKRYGVLFTCLACRAIHVETANSLSTDSFINSLRRLFAIRGPIRQLRSDRGTNFVGAERELREAVSELDQEGIRQFLLKENCDYFEFKMNVPSASHMGGVWERQIRSVRKVMSHLLHEHGSQLDDESLRTFLYEASAIVNSRPLCVETINDPLSDLPLSPNLLLTMKTNVILPPPGNFQKSDLYSRKHWRRTQHLVNEFWKRWRSEYLQNLQVRNKWNIAKRNVSVGDVVLLKEHNLARNDWRLCRVDQVTKDEDGLVRKAKIAIGTSDLDNKGKRRASVTYLERPVHELVLLKETEEVPNKEP